MKGSLLIAGKLNPLILSYNLNLLLFVKIEKWTDKIVRFTSWFNIMLLQAGRSSAQAHPYKAKKFNSSHEYIQTPVK